MDDLRPLEGEESLLEVKFLHSNMSIHLISFTFHRLRCSLRFPHRHFNQCHLKHDLPASANHQLQIHRLKKTQYPRGQPTTRGRLSTSPRFSHGVHSRLKRERELRKSENDGRLYARRRKRMPISGKPRALSMSLECRPLNMQRLGGNLLERRNHTSRLLYLCLPHLVQRIQET